MAVFRSIFSLSLRDPVHRYTVSARMRILHEIPRWIEETQEKQKEKESTNNRRWEWIASWAELKIF